MTKPGASELAHSVRTELTTYLGEGQVNPMPLAETAPFDRYEITDFDRLKAIHFILYSDVVEFLDRLPDRLRRLKTVTETATNVTEGEVRGAINWSETLRERARRGFDDPTVFVTEAPDPVADIPENRVLRGFLEVVRDELTVLSEYKTDWVNPQQERAIQHAVTALDRHILLASLSTSETTKLSNRDLNVARRSRHDIYSEAARLYRLYEALQQNEFDRSAVQEILTSTVIRPSEPHRVYELYCVFHLIKLLQEQFPIAKLAPVEPGSKEVARFRTLRKDSMEAIRVYWDQSGPYSFADPVPTDIDVSSLPAAFQRFAAAKTEGEDRVTGLEGSSSEPMLYRGRPDVLVERRAETATEPTELLVGEFKYSDRAGQLRAGVRELSEYLQFVRRNGTHYYGLESVTVSGLLCTEFSDVERSRYRDVVHCTSTEFEQAVSETVDADASLSSVRELVADVIG